MEINHRALLWTPLEGSMDLHNQVILWNKESQGLALLIKVQC